MNSNASASTIRPSATLDYSLVGANANRAVELGLAEADWYQTPISRAELRKLLQREDGPAIRDTVLLFTLLGITGYATVVLWGTWWAVAPYFLYATLYGTSSDSRWHECEHGTAFRTDWMNSVLYEIASFMVMRESVVWRWSHTRHHSDTIIVGRDPEIQVPRPPDLWGLLLSLFNVGGYRAFFTKIVNHALGRMMEDEKTYIPETEYPKIHLRARIYVLIYAIVIASALTFHSWLPIFLFVLPQFFGTWLMIVHNTPQHAGLAENVLDHRLNCRTVYMNPISRFIYWNMNYHLEHHMYPLVPYHALPRLHELIKDDCPPPYQSISSAWREIFPTLLKQVKDPAYHVKRKIPAPKNRTQEARYRSTREPDADGWVKVCAGTDLGCDDVLRFDLGRKTFAVYRDANRTLYASDGVCTHGNTHLADGLVKGGVIECPKHNGRFYLEDGSPARAPVCRGVATYPVEERAGQLWLNVERSGGDGARQQRVYTLKVVSNRNVSTFIKELVLELVDPAETMDFKPGDYLQFNIPSYDEIHFRDFDVPEPFASVWRHQHIFELSVANHEEGRRNNYSIASNMATGEPLMFNVRIATPPAGQDCPPGVGSSYMFSLKTGDMLKAIGPFGDFHIKPTRKEMVYIGGGAGMAPLRAHLSYLLETENTARKISYWYGARSKQELYYADYFKRLAEAHDNFDFQVALSKPLETDEWTSHVGLIHDVVHRQYLHSHANLNAVEFYLCGPPMMINACTKMLAGLGVKPHQIAYDEF